ncbi:response regulator transcription factor [Streptomyces pathocidini]|uniref:Response regulator transcription factor n=1 Tax=Streptomyces pathocidini TaxID=1650571 RepID=A0ABW7UUH3_9ACTN|nr:response regulator transcription factor [Streptomyces pathocidini]
MSQRNSPEAGLCVLAHSGLRASFDSPDAPLSGLRAGLDRVEFVDERQLAAPGTPDLPVLMPVTSEFQAEDLRAVRLQHPLALLVAVTNDLSGHQTYYAIRSGANFVFNMAIPEERQVDLLLAQCRAHCTGSAPDRAAVAGRLRALPARESPPTPPAAAPIPGVDYDPELLRLLCTSATVSEIARRYYCSERSMYRRIRRLYDALGVSGRSELLPLAAELGLRRPSPARAG